MLENTLFVSNISQDHALAKSPIEAVWGFRSPDFDGSYDQNFLRQIQSDNDILSFV